MSVSKRIAFLEYSEEYWLFFSTYENHRGCTAAAIQLRCARSWRAAG